MQNPPVPPQGQAGDSPNSSQAPGWTLGWGPWGKPRTLSATLTPPGRGSGSSKGALAEHRGSRAELTGREEKAQLLWSDSPGHRGVHGEGGVGVPEATRRERVHGLSLPEKSGCKGPWSVWSGKKGEEKGLEGEGIAGGDTGK